MTDEKSTQSAGLKKAYPKVFIFAIHKALSDGRSAYDATRDSWHVSETLREEPFGIAVGIKDKTSQGIFEIKGWHPAGNRWEFDGIETAETESLYDIDWSIIINKASGYWGFGNYLVVEIDDNTRFRFIKGNKNKSWYSLR